MAMYNQVVFYLSLFAASGLCYTKPDTRCEESNTKCITKLAQNIINTAVNGSEDLGIKSLDPIHQELVEVELPTLKYSIKDAELSGYKDMVTNEVKLLSPGHLSYDFTFPRIEMTARLEIKGELFNVPIDAKVKYFVNATNLHMQLNTTKQLYNKNGKTHFRNKNLKLNSELLGTLHVDQEAISDEYDKIPEAVLKYINENPHVVLELSQNRFGIANMKQMMANVDKVLETVSLDDFIIPGSYRV